MWYFFFFYPLYVYKYITTGGVILLFRAWNCDVHKGVGILTKSLDDGRTYSIVLSSIGCCFWHGLLEFGLHIIKTPFSIYFWRSTFVEEGVTTMVLRCCGDVVVVFINIVFEIRKEKLCWPYEIGRGISVIIHLSEVMTFRFSVVVYEKMWWKTKKIKRIK